MKLIVKKGRTGLLVRIFIQDSSSTVGAGLTGLTSGSAGLVCYRARDDDGNAAATQVVLSAGTRGTWSSGGFVEKDATNMPGVYELGLPDAGQATGSETVTYMLKGATNMAPLALEAQLVAFDPQDAVHLGLSAIPNTAVTTNGSLITSGTGADQLSVATGRVDLGKILGTASAGQAGSVSPDWAQVKNPTTVLDLTQTTIKNLDGNTVQTGDSFARLGAPAGASVSADVAAVKTDTGTILTDVNTGAGAIYNRIGAPVGASVSADIAAVKASVGSPMQAGTQVTVGVNNDKTGYVLTAIGSAAMTEDYAAKGASPTLNQMLFMLLQSLHEFAISGTTRTVKKLDGATSAMTFTLDSATNPTSTTRAT